MIPTGSLIATPTTLGLKGSNVTLRWSSPYSNKTVLDNGIGQVYPSDSGSITTFAMFNTTYAATFSNSSGAYIATASVIESLDPTFTNADGSLTTNVFRSISGGIVGLNLTRPTGDGTPSYQIRSKYVPYVPPPTTAQVVWTVTHGTYMVAPFTGPMLLAAIDVSDKTNPVIITDTVFDVSWTANQSGNAWTGMKSLWVDANYIYYNAVDAGKMMVRRNNTTNPAIIASGSMNYASLGYVKYKTNTIISYNLGPGAGQASVSSFDISGVASSLVPIYTVPVVDNHSGFPDTNPLKSSGSQTFCIVNGKAVAFTVSNTGFKEISSIDPIASGTWTRANVAYGDSETNWYSSHSAVCSKGQYVYRVVYYNGNVVLTVLNSLNAYAPGTAINLSTGYGSGIPTMFLKGNYILVVNRMLVTGGIKNFLWVVDITNPTTPVEIKAIASAWDCYYVRPCFDGTYLYVFSFFEGTQSGYAYRLIDIYDCTDITNPVLVAHNGYGSLLGFPNSDTQHAAVGCHPMPDEGGNIYIP